MVLTNSIARGRDRGLSPVRRSLAEIANIDFDFFKAASCYLNMGWVEGRAAFEAGPATVVGLARSSLNGQATDAHQWLVNVTLFRE